MQNKKPPPPAVARSEPHPFRLSTGAGAAAVMLSGILLLFATYLIARYVGTAPKGPSKQIGQPSHTPNTPTAQTSGASVSTGRSREEASRIAAQAQAAAVEGAFRRKLDTAQELLKSEDFAGASKAVDQATALITQDMVSVWPEGVVKSNAEVHDVRAAIARSQTEVLARETERRKVEHDTLLRKVVADSQGRLAEVAPVENASPISLSSTAIIAPIRMLVEEQCKATVIDPAKTPAAELVARGAEVRVVFVKVVRAEVRNPPPSFGDGTPLKVVETMMLVTVRKASNNEQVWSKQVPGRKTYFAAEVTGQSDGALVDRLITAGLRELETDASFKAAF